MVQVVFVPGIFGTTMVGADGFEWWPPVGQAQPVDAQTRATKLIDPDTHPGKILEKIAILPLLDVPEYAPVLEAIARFPGASLVRFPYDWRADVASSAAALAATIEQLNPTDEVVLIGHSMGGLVCRMMLEVNTWQKRKWFKQIGQFISVATPHLGAPEAVFRILALEGLDWLIFPGPCFGILASVPDRFPGGHQLLSPGQRACVRLPNGTQTSVAAAFPQISSVGISKMEAMHALLKQFKRPASVDYKVVFGFGTANTTTGVILDQRGHISHEFGDGDGTVPVWSSMPDVPHGFFVAQASVRGSHLGILNDVTFLDQLQRWITPVIS